MAFSSSGTTNFELGKIYSSNSKRPEFILLETEPTFGPTLSKCNSVSGRVLESRARALERKPGNHKCSTNVDQIERLEAS